MNLIEWFRKRRRMVAPPDVVEPDGVFLVDWRRLMAGSQISWVLFKHGTGVLFFERGLDLRAEATTLLRQFGPVGAGSSFGDFGVRKAPDDTGWMVSSHHHQILTYVRPDELALEKRNQLGIGFYGRAKRSKDAAMLEIIHVENADDERR